MKQKLLLAFFLGCSITSTVSAGTYEWTSDWAQGVSEYLVDDGNGNELNISCSNEEGHPVTAFATIGGKQFSSDDEVGFDVIIDGVGYSNPFFTDCHACGNAFPAFWKALRNANHLQISDEHKTVNLSSKNLANVVLPLDSSENSCKSAW
ncbi:hypothetical protein [Pseudomonas frederiksbergensis]|uniref:hypothetical protein n=1 Tax=Pseudomonas frederiksbergensis TaxID=104087 RepID=UPI000F463006|nr:hypothetical protein [Pseudomonas frederiksbergensis]RON49603.1 hypothetical protein BK667_19895 [Pseudomonas frederiksbergensis]